MQPSETITTGIDYHVLEHRWLAHLLDLSLDYRRQRPWLLTALGVTEQDLREWEAASTSPPKIEVIAVPEEDQDFDVPPATAETEFILDDPDEEDEDDEDAEKPEDESDDDESEDSDDDESEDDEDGSDDDGDFDADDVIIDDDDGEG